ncbi:MAG TPA: sugar phosphate isomerase/epimerase [Tepidisphaeraceae bacterium]|jgi:sugar phosphate isomerase/epimerase|nr:sugar phosphate isomerase/epimerase [Tepidisphaeraceae bacterium]
MASTLAVQMYTLREFTKTPADIASTLARVKKMGYNAVQLSALGPIDPAELAKILKNEGLAVAATHTGMDRMRDQTQAVIDEHKMWGCELTAIGGFWPKDEWSAETWSTFIREYSDIARKFAGSGVSIGYHNHHHEFRKAGDKVALRRVLEESDPSVWMEIDTYWVTAGGGDPAKWIRDCKGRIPAIHLKDMGVNAENKAFMMEVGEGNLNWPAIIDACKAAGVKWHIVEQDTCYRDPFESLEISLRNLKALGLS